MPNEPHEISVIVVADPNKDHGPKLEFSRVPCVGEIIVANLDDPGDPGGRLAEWEVTKVMHTPSRPVAAVINVTKRDDARGASSVR
jgi:hypothetical protein